MMKRLTIFLCAAALSSAAFAQDSSNWSVTQNMRAGLEEQETSAQLLSTDGSSLAVVCDGSDRHILSIRFTSRKNIGSSDNLVSVRFDTDPQFRPTKWTYQNNRAASIDDTTYVDAFLQQVGAGEREIRIRALNFMNQPIDALFVSKNGADSINKIKEYCGKPAT